MVDYCDLCDKEKLVERSDDYALKVCKSCNEKYPEKKWKLAPNVKKKNLMQNLLRWAYKDIQCVIHAGKNITGIIIID